MIEPVEMFDCSSDMSHDNFNEMCTFVLVSSKDTIVNDNGGNNNNDCVCNNSLFYQNEDWGKHSKPVDCFLKKSEETVTKIPFISSSLNYTSKAKRGRPCAKPPTKEILGRRRKVCFATFKLVNAPLF